MDEIKTDRFSTCTFIAFPTVVIYRYKWLGIINRIGVTILHTPHEGVEDWEKAVKEKTGIKKLTVIEHT